MSTKTDPLYVIFENHLLHFEDSNIDRKAFILNVVTEYVTTVRKMKIAVPMRYEKAIVEELTDQVGKMLTKKIYGCLNIEEFQTKTPDTEKKKARTRYNKLRAKAG